MEAAISSKDADCSSLPAAISSRPQRGRSVRPQPFRFLQTTEQSLGAPLRTPYRFTALSLPCDTLAELRSLFSTVSCTIRCMRPISPAISLAASADSSASLRTSSETTENPARALQPGPPQWPRSAPAISLLSDVSNDVHNGTDLIGLFIQILISSRSWVTAVSISPITLRVCSICLLPSWVFPAYCGPYRQCPESARSKC